MKYIFYCSVLAFLVSCNNKKPIVDPAFIDSLVNHYSTSITAITNARDLAFWKSRVDSMPASFVNQQKYAQAKPLLNSVRQIPADPNYIDANYYYGFIAFRERRKCQST